MQFPTQGGRTRSLLLTAALFAAALPARAGMPSLTLIDLAEARLQTISFFLVLFFASALAVKGLWNYLRRDFARLPHLTYGRALAVVGLWGLLFVLVLTMISGARELMTPGAWEKGGLTYRLKSGPEGEQTRAIWDAVTANRRTRLLELKVALWSYAAGHGGRFPLDDQDAEIATGVWETPDPSRVRYVYVAGYAPLAAGSPHSPVVAYEPKALPVPRLALMADGQVRTIDEVKLQAALKRTLAPAAPTTQPGGQPR